jgi:hypothetical protein
MKSDAYVLFTAEAEKARQAYAQGKRIAKPTTKPQYELLNTVSLVEAVHFAQKNGWKDKKVQVKSFRINDTEMEYIVEPFETDCKCPNLLRYDDYFGGGE